MLTDACERLLGQAASTKQMDERSKEAAVPLLNGNKIAVVPLLFVKLKLFFDLHTFAK